MTTFLLYAILIVIGVLFTFVITFSLAKARREGRIFRFFYKWKTNRVIKKLNEENKRDKQ